MADTKLDITKSDLDRNIAFILGDLSRLLKVVFDRRIKGLGLTRTQWFLLAHLYRADGLTQTELSDLLELEKATVGKTIDRLEENGWIFRKNDPTDRRVKRIHLTDKFARHVEELQTKSNDVIGDAFSHLGEKEFSKLVDDLFRARTNLLEQSKQD